MSLCYTEAFQDNVFTFANNIYTAEGGMHMVGFRTALTRVINAFARKQELLKDKDENLTGDDVREGLVAIVSVKLGQPQFEGQTKNKLSNVEVRTAVEALFADKFNEFLEENPGSARSIVGKSCLAARARLAARAARDAVHPVQSGPRGRPARRHRRRLRRHRLHGVHNARRTQQHEDGGRLEGGQPSHQGTPARS